MTSVSISRVAIMMLGMASVCMLAFFIFVAWKTEHIEPVFASLLVAFLFTMVLLTHPRRVIVTSSAFVVEHYIRRERSWPLKSVKVSVFKHRSDEERVLRVFVESKRSPVAVLSREMLGAEFDDLLKGFAANSVKVSDDPFLPNYLPRVERVVDGVTEVHYRGWLYVVHSVMAACGMFVIAYLFVTALPWDAQIAIKEKWQVCVGAAIIGLIGFWFMPRGVSGVVFRENKVTIKRVWKRKLILTRHDIKNVSGGRPRRYGLRYITLETSHGVKAEMFEGWLGSRPGELWGDLAEFASDKCVDPPTCVGGSNI